jgi:hypothetical protein
MVLTVHCFTVLFCCWTTVLYGTWIILIFNSHNLLRSSLERVLHFYQSISISSMSLCDGCFVLRIGLCMILVMWLKHVCGWSFLCTWSICSHAVVYVCLRYLFTTWLLWIGRRVCEFSSTLFSMPKAKKWHILPIGRRKVLGSYLGGVTYM